MTGVSPPTDSPQERRPSPQGSLKARIVSGVLYTFLARVVDRLSGLLQNVIVARMLGAADLGLLAVITSAVQVFCFPFGSFEESLTKFAAEAEGPKRREAEHILGSAFVILSVMGTLLAVLCIILAPHMSGGETEAVSSADITRVTFLVRLQSAQVLTRPLLVVATGTLGGLLLIQVVAQRNMGVRLFLLAGSIVGAKLMGLLGVVIAIVAAELVSLVVSWGITFRSLAERGLRLRLGDVGALRRLFGLVAPLFAATVITALWPWFTASTLTHRFGPEMAGYWRVALSFLMTSRAVSAATGYASLPMTSHLLSAGGAPLGAALTRIMRASLWINGAASVLLIVLAPWLVSWVYGGEFQAAWPVVAVVSMAIITLALRDPLFSYLIGSGQAGVLLATEAVGVSLYVAALSLGAADYGAVGVAWAYVGYGLVTTLPAIARCTRRHGLRLRALLPLWCGAALMALGACCIAFLCPPRFRLLVGVPYAAVASIAAIAGLLRTDPEVVASVFERLRRPAGPGADPDEIGE